MAIAAKRTSRTAAKPARPAKPYPDFPLFPHATGRWAKKIRGRFAFFGPWADPQGALARYVAQRDELYAGLVPRSPTAGTRPVTGTIGPAMANGRAAAAGFTVRDLVNHFLTAKQRRLDAGEMGRRGFSDYHATCGRLVAELGIHRLVEDLTSSDFGVLRASLAETRGPVALGNEVNRVRSVFKYGYDAGLLERPMRFGPEFIRPPRRAVRLAKHAQGERMFEATEIRTLLEAAPTALKAMILLGINCGLGNSDVSDLPRSALHFKSAILEFPRPKTGIRRRAVLWPETVEAIKIWLKDRPEPRDAVDKDIVFLTQQGRRWVRVSDPGVRSKGKTQAVVTDSVGLLFGRLMRETKTHTPGRSFYALRHTFRTVADELGDRRAIDLVMGHEPGGDIATHYVERIEDERLMKVAGHVRQWLYR